MSVNRVFILGRLGQDPEVKHTPSGSAVANFSVATSEAWTDKSGQKQERTEWHRVVVWGKLAELCGQYLSKGRQVYLEGKLQTRSWDDKEGNKRYTTEVQASTVQFIGGSQQANQNESVVTQQHSQDMGETNFQQIQPNETFAADDIPF